MLPSASRSGRLTIVRTGLVGAMFQSGVVLSSPVASTASKSESMSPSDFTDTYRPHMPRRTDRTDERLTAMTGSAVRSGRMCGVQAWAAPRVRRPVRARVELPGSKSLTNRALVIAALADGPTRIEAPLRARDTELMAGGARALGADVADDGADWVVTPGPLHGAAIDTGLAGT